MSHILDPPVETGSITDRALGRCVPGEQRCCHPLALCSFKEADYSTVQSRFVISELRNWYARVYLRTESWRR